MPMREACEKRWVQIQFSSANESLHSRESGEMGLLLVFGLAYFVAGFGATETSTAAAAGKCSSELKKTRMPGFLYIRTAGRCTPQHWSSGREAWPHIVPQESSVAKVFGSRVLERYEPGLTMWEATQRNDDVGGGSAFSKLVKQSSVALLNAYTRPGFPYGAWEVKTLLLEALVSEDAAASQARSFELANQACN